MALDKNLFTLNIEQSKIEQAATDLVDPSGTVHYRKRLLPNEAGTYLLSLYDPLSDSLLATATAPSPTSKEKVVELYNPSATVTLSFKGTLTFKWSFTWEQHEFEWRREACYMIRKPDPPVLVAITKEPAGKIKTSLVQILDYNLNRFDVDDRKGLEIVLLTSLLTFSDQSEQPRTKSIDVPAVAPTTPPAAPPKPEGWDDQIAILQAKEQREINEVVIGEAGSVDDYARHCVSLLNDDTLLFITLRSHSPQFVSKVVQVAEATKRTRYKNGGWDEELHQYVSTGDDTAKEKGQAKGPPRVINLNDGPPSAGPSKSYKPPASLTIHLSKISMPELEPKAKRTQQSLPNTGTHSKLSSETKGKKSSATSSKSRPASPTQQPNGLRAKFSRSSSPSPGPRPSSAPHANAASHHPPPRPQMPSHSRTPSNSQYGHPLHAGRPPHSHSSPHLARPNSNPPPGPGPAYTFQPGPGHLNVGYTPYPAQFIPPPQPPQPQPSSSGGFLGKLMGR